MASEFSIFKFTRLHLLFTTFTVDYMYTMYICCIHVQYLHVFYMTTHVHYMFKYTTPFKFHTEINVLCYTCIYISI